MIIVAGITRSGLTVTMQMLHAGGIPCAGEYPAFEPYSIEDIPWEQCRGKAVKLVDAHLQIPTDGDYSIIRLHRNPKEQARSFNKFSSSCGLPTMRASRVIATMRRDYKTIDRWAGRHRRIDLKFENIIRYPRETAELIARWIGQDLDIDKMAAVVAKRDPQCLPYMLEVYQ